MNFSIIPVERVLRVADNANHTRLKIGSSSSSSLYYKQENISGFNRILGDKKTEFDILQIIILIHFT